MPVTNCGEVRVVGTGDGGCWAKIGCYVGKVDLLGVQKKLFQRPIKNAAKVDCLVVLYPNMRLFFGQVERFYGTKERFLGHPIIEK